MIVLDANVISELARRQPDHSVAVWLDSVIDSEVVTAAELFYGVARLPQSRRKVDLAEAVRGLLNEGLHSRIEPFDVQIAATCRRLAAQLATRNTSDFEGTGISLVNPWNPRWRDLASDRCAWPFDPGVGSE